MFLVQISSLWPETSRGSPLLWMRYPSTRLGTESYRNDRVCSESIFLDVRQFGVFA